MAEESGKLLPAFPVLPTPLEVGPEHSPMTAAGDLASVSVETEMSRCKLLLYSAFCPHRSPVFCPLSHPDWQ